MGNKISAVNGVKSSDFYRPGNAVNEIWWGDMEVVSRLPFGDSDMAQAGWPKGEWPKIPWRPFIIPLRAAAESTVKKRALSPELLSCQRLAGPFKNAPSITPAAVCWIATQILIVPIAAVPILLNASPDLTSSVSSRCFPCPFRMHYDMPRKVDVHPAKLRSAALLYAMIGTIFYLLALPLVVFDGFAISAARFCKPVNSGSHSALWGLAYALYGGVSGTLILAATYSVVRLWMTYFKAKALDNQECLEDDDGMKGAGDEVIVLESQFKGKQEDDGTGVSDTPLSVEELESIAADTFWDMEGSPGRGIKRNVPGAS